MIHHVSLLISILLVSQSLVSVWGLPSVVDGGDGRSPLQINQDLQIAQTMGPVTPNGCSKQMSWNGGQETFDKDQVAERLTLYNNVWGAAHATSDSRQSVKCNSYQQGVMDWSTSVSFKSKDVSSNNQVKSYSNVGWAGKPIRISALKTFRSTWNWSMTGQSPGMVTDVSYDIFTSFDANCSGQGGGCASHEIMIWLAAIGGAAPAGSKTGKRLKIGTAYEFEVWKGVVGGIPVISLVPLAGKLYTRFNGDFIPLLQRELVPFGLSPSEYITTVGAGPEPFQGSFTLNGSYTLRLL